MEAREDDATLLENNDGAMSMEKDESEEVSPASVGEDESFIVTETEPVSTIPANENIVTKFVLVATIVKISSRNVCVSS